MQQGLRPYVQDENALAALHRPAALSSLKSGNHDSENAGPLGAKGAGGFPAVRKALGNLTNSSVGLAAEGTLHGKTPGGAPVMRRALGDITNSKAAKPPGQKVAQKAAPMTAQPAAVPLHQQATAAASAASRADALAADGVERIAGRSWEQLEADRLAAEDAEVSARLAALANFPCLAMPTFFPSWGLPMRARDLQKDVLLSPPPSPVAQRPAWPGSDSIGDVNPSEVALPEVSDAEDLLMVLDGW